MSAGTLERISLEREQVPIRREVRQEIGASACNGCPLVALGCPGKPEAARECPPEAKVIAQEEIPEALANDSIGSIFPASGGGYIALPEKARQYQTAIMAPKVKLKPPIKEKQTAVMEQFARSERRRDKRLGRLATRSERQGRERETDLMAVLGALVLIFFGGLPSELAKK